MPDHLSKYKTAALFLLLLGLVYFPVFLHLDYMPFRMWDESILGVNAIEMGQNHQYLVTHFFGPPDMVNCKPPFMIWCILLSTKLLGFSELSVRLPSAIAALMLCVYLFFSLRKYTGSAVYSFLVVLVLVTCQGYIRNHVTRTGEYDSLLVLFATLFSLHLFWATESGEAAPRSRHLLLFFVFLTLAVLTKGVAGFMLLPGLGIYVLLRGQLLNFLKNKSLYIGLAIFLLFGVGYYFAREAVNPGYLLAVWNNELGGRFGKVNDGNTGPFIFYLKEIITWQFVEYMFLFPVAVIAGLRFSSDPIRRLVTFSCITGGLFLLVISISKTKLPHYDAPLFPHLAIITASLFYLLFLTLRDVVATRTTAAVAGLLAFCCILLLLARPYQNILSKVYFPKGDFWEENFSVSTRYFQDLYQGKEPYRVSKMVFDASGTYGPMTVLTCYQHQLKQKGYDIQLVHHQDLSAGDRVAVFDDYIRQQIEAKFETEWLEYAEHSHTSVLHLTKEKGH